MSKSLSTHYIYAKYYPTILDDECEQIVVVYTLTDSMITA
jgi:hypothetical protein